MFIIGTFNKDYKGNLHKVKKTIRSYKRETSDKKYKNIVNSNKFDYVNHFEYKNGHAKKLNVFVKSK